ncbi:MAG: glycerol-3-phosphate dehydrogenase [NAD(P)+] [Rhodothalassiaceae bacterium]|nr:MAG: glycerol-3-phosphate dehydrogenase [NAD(P)+] [Rhodothalassiaceae bacterium]
MAEAERTIGVLGAGAWGTALAAVAARRGIAVRLWAREPEVAEAVNGRRENPVYLPGIPLPEGITAASDYAVLGDCGVVLVVTPAQFMGAVLAEARAALRADAVLVLCAKGIERGSGRLMSEVAAAAAPGHPLAVLSGPTFAHEVARNLPAAVTIASDDPAVAERILRLLGQPTFRPYTSRDVIGAQIGGAVKNVIAIACGVVDGLGLGQNARAALIARGLKEMIRFGLARGARAETMTGLSGAGDLVLTCTSTDSRNMSLGRELGRGRRLEEVLGERRSVAEGVWTAGILAEIARREGIAMPITEAVHALVGRGEPVEEVVRRLLNRPFTSEEEEGHALSRDRA